MGEKQFHEKVWRTLAFLLHRGFEWKFNFKHENYTLERPALIISNHVTNYDPIFVGVSFPKSQMYFVASEHLFRRGLTTKLIRWLFAPIARRKGSNGMDTAMATMRKLRDGSSVCIFGEGETTWNGISQGIVPSTGNLAKICRADLITYRLEGGYLTAPRWGQGTRRGQMHGRIVNRYTPEQLKTMTPDEVTALINRDLYENAWERQKEEPVCFKGKKLAEKIEIALFMCPKCHGIGTVYGQGNRVKCSCGLDIEYTQTGHFAPAEPFADMVEWDRWQHEELLAGNYDHANAKFFEDDVTLTEVDSAHQERVLTTGRMMLEDGALKLGEYSFDLQEIADMALVQRTMIVFSSGGKYYEMECERPCCMRKYLAIWKKTKEN